MFYVLVNKEDVYIECLRLYFSEQRIKNYKIFGILRILDNIQKQDFLIKLQIQARIFRMESLRTDKLDKYYYNNREECFIYDQRHIFMISLFSDILNNISNEQQFLTNMKLAQLLLFVLLSQTVLSISEYRVVNATHQVSNITLVLQYFGKDDYYGKPSSPIIKKLKFVYQSLTSEQFYFKITDLEEQRFKTLQGDAFPSDSYINYSYPLNYSATFRYTGDPFDFEIIQNEGSVVIFSTYENPFIFSDYYIEFTTQLNTDLLYGLGERFSSNLRKTNGKYTIYNQANGQQIDDGSGSYGYYPYYLLIDNCSTSHFGYLKSTSPMDIIKWEKNDKHYLTFKIIGGIVNFRYIFNVSTGQARYTFLQGYIKKNALPPLWALGFHQSRQGYQSASQINQVIDAFESYGLPLDAVWSDMDYMEDSRDFTVNKNFPQAEMKKITDRCHYVPIINSGIAVDTQAYKIGHERNVFIKDANGSQLIGKDTSPVNTVFVDFFHPNASAYWSEMLAGLDKKLNFSGIWLNKNEIENFCDGPCSSPLGPSKFDFSKDLPYIPGNGKIELRTISLNSTHYGGLREFDVKPYFGLMQAKATFDYLNSSGKKPFVLSRSSTFGSTRFSFHWTGENKASWEFLRSSLIDNMNMNSIGYQLMGPDICGYSGNTTEELCARWYQMAAVYTFARSHSDSSSVPQEPFALGNKVLKSAMTNLKLRYSLLKQFYSDYIISYGIGVSKFLSLAFQPELLSNITDRNKYDYISNTQFSRGGILMVTPILEEGTNTRQIFIPSGQYNWRDFYTGKIYSPGFHTITNQMTDKVPIFIYRGYSWFVQNVTGIRKSSQLSNKFIMVAPFQGDQQGGMTTIGFLLSLNNMKRIDECPSYGCDYKIILRYALVNDQEILLRLSVSPSARSVRQEIFIEGFRLYIDDTVINYQPPEPLSIYENTEYKFSIPNKPVDPSEDKFWESIQVDQPATTSQLHILSRE